MSHVIGNLCPVPPFLVSNPDPHPKRKEGSGEYSTTFLYLHGISAAQSDWLMFQLSHLYWASLLQTTYHTFTDLLSTPPIY